MDDREWWRERAREIRAEGMMMMMMMICKHKYNRRPMFYAITRKNVLFYTKTRFLTVLISLIFPSIFS